MGLEKEFSFRGPLSQNEQKILKNIHLFIAIWSKKIQYFKNYCYLLS